MLQDGGRGYCCRMGIIGNNLGVGEHVVLLSLIIEVFIVHVGVMCLVIARLTYWMLWLVYIPPLCPSEELRVIIYHSREWEARQD